MLLKIGDCCLDVDDDGYISFSRKFCNLVEYDDNLISPAFPELHQNIVISGCAQTNEVIVKF